MLCVGEIYYVKGNVLSGSDILDALILVSWLNIESHIDTLYD